MNTVNVFGEILEWSIGRPSWQRDALRRIVAKGDLDESDIGELANLCRSEYGLGDRIKPVFLSKDHIPNASAMADTVSLQSLTHHRGVNALAPNQTVEFGSSLTVIFGANAAGKSGYTRILKRACRARGAEEILGNVISGTAPGNPSATIEFKANKESRAIGWDDNSPPDRLLSRVSVFDRHCASVYVAKRTDVAFRPMGLDLFDKLSDACEAVKKILEKDRNTLEAEALQFPDVAEGTTVHELIAGLTSLTNPSTVKGHARLTCDEKARGKELRNRIRDLSSDTPQKIARTIELRANRVRTLAARVTDAVESLSDNKIAELFDAHETKNKTREILDMLDKKAFQDQPLSNTGSPAWRALWNAAEHFSTSDAYPDQAFPVTEEASRCVLCQQELTEDGVQRFRHFHNLLGSTAQGDFDSATEEYNEMYDQFDGIVVLDENATEVLDELQLDEPDLSAAIRQCLDAAEARRQITIKALHCSSDVAGNLPDLSFDIRRLTDYVERLEIRARELREDNHLETISKLSGELSELEARQVLAEHIDRVLEEIERKKKIAAYQLCIDETRTNSITRKSSDLTKRAVTKQLTASFSDELEALRFHHVEVQLVDAGASRGALYHRLKFRRAPDADVSKVVSEGEARCLSIASFFAELSTATDRSAILFDDPVSSLDHNWRANVAKRLVVESKSRQVIVFTHDIVFLLALMENSNELNVELKHQYLRRDNTAAGLSSRELPWAALKVSARIRHLNSLWQDAESTFRKGDPGEYVKDASYIYGLLREAWERAVEEVLLAGTVERYRNSVQTQRADQLADICENDITTLKSGMTKCSKWLTGHDQSPADNSPIPGPQEVKYDIETLDEWIRSIRKRRDN